MTAGKISSVQSRDEKGEMLNWLTKSVAAGDQLLNV